MSASQEKKKRISDRSAEKEKLAAEQAAEAKKKSLKKVRNIIIAVVVVLVIAAIFVINSNLFYTGMDAVDVNGTKYTAAEAGYMYRTIYSSYLNQLNSAAQQYGLEVADYASMVGLDTSQPLNKQVYPYSETGEETWADYFREQTLESLRTLTMHVDKAKAEGFALTDEEIDEIDANLSVYDYYASISGYSSTAQYLAAQFGKGVTMDTVRKMAQLSQLSANYAQKVLNDFTYSDEVLDTWYSNHKNEYDVILYRQTFFSGDGTNISSEPTEEDEARAMEEAKTNAETLMSMATDEESFERLAAGQEGRTPNVEPSGRSHAMGSNLSTYYREWLLDEARQPGDMEVLEGYNGYYVVYFVGRDNNSYTMKQVRHILVKAIATDDGEYTEDTKDLAWEQACAILDDWKDGEATEESFAELANQYSEDAGSNTSGGLFDQVVRYQYVQGFEDFAFDESRKPGDTDIVYGEGSSYVGYHIMYFVGEGERYDHYIASNELRNADAQDWENGNLASYEATTNFSFRFVK